LRSGTKAIVDEAAASIALGRLLYVDRAAAARSHGRWITPVKHATSCDVHYGPVAQRIEQQPSKLKVAGSIPAGVASEFN
jgi:hypothetical protein